MLEVEVEVEVGVGVGVGVEVDVDTTLSFRHSLDGVPILFRVDGWVDGLVGGWLAGEMGIKANLNSSCSLSLTWQKPTTKTFKGSDSIERNLVLTIISDCLIIKIVGSHKSGLSCHEILSLQGRGN